MTVAVETAQTSTGRARVVRGPQWPGPFPLLVALALLLARPIAYLALFALIVWLL